VSGAEGRHRAEVAGGIRRHVDLRRHRPVAVCVRDEGAANGFDSAGVYATLYPLYRNESQFEVEAIGLAGAASATNPRWRAFCQLYDYAPINAAVGALSVVTVDFIAVEPITPYTT
jgi:hypothetical protein